MALLPACTCLSCPAHGEAAVAALAGQCPEPGGAGGFAGSGRLFGEITSWLAGPDAGGLTHGGLEDELGSRSRELSRRLYQDHLDLRAAREERRQGVTGADGIARTRAEAGHARSLSTVFGPVTVSRIAYRAPGAANVHPADEELSLPAGRHSHGLARLAASAAARMSFGQACAEVTARTGSVLGKRQCQQLIAAAAADFAGFYASRRPPPGAGPGDVLVLSCDGKGVMVRPGHLRPRTAQESCRDGPKQDGRLSRGEVRTRKRMAGIGAVCDLAPVPRTPGDILGPGPRPDGPRAERKWLTATITAGTAGVVADVFAEASRRDPGRQRTWIALADGDNHQIRQITARAAARGLTITIICDFIHVTEYLWNAAWCFFPEASPGAAPWVRRHAAAILDGHATQTAAAIRDQATATTSLSKTKRKTAARTANYLTAKAPYLNYPAALAAGWPITTGIIEGACRHLVKDRMDITGARWGVPTAQAILQLRALHANGDLDTYWTYHLNREHHRNHPHPQTSYQLTA